MKTTKKRVAADGRWEEEEEEQEKITPGAGGRIGSRITDRMTP